MTTSPAARYREVNDVYCGGRFHRKRIKSWEVLFMSILLFFVAATMIDSACGIPIGWLALPASLVLVLLLFILAIYIPITCGINVYLQYFGEHVDGRVVHVLSYEQIDGDEFNYTTYEIEALYYKDGFQYRKTFYNQLTGPTSRDRLHLLLSRTNPKIAYRKAEGWPFLLIQLSFLLSPLFFLMALALIFVMFALVQMKLGYDDATTEILIDKYGLPIVSSLLLVATVIAILMIWEEHSLSVEEVPALLSSKKLLPNSNDSKELPDIPSCSSDPDEELGFSYQV